MAIVAIRALAPDVPRHERAACEHRERDDHRAYARQYAPCIHDALLRRRADDLVPGRVRDGQRGVVDLVLDVVAEAVDVADRVVAIEHAALERALAIANAGVRTLEQ